MLFAELLLKPGEGCIRIVIDCPFDWTKILLQQSIRLTVPETGPREVRSMASAGPQASSSTGADATSNSSSGNTTGESSNQDSTFECNICLDTSKDAVISLCGHLFW